MSNTKMVNIRLPVDMKEQLRVAAEHDSRTVSGLITAILKNWLRESAKVSPPIDYVKAGGEDE